ncbi:MAG: hypothetical protein Q4B22_07095 [Eubacteriales bacterium]|nr:hypothetical protein [Eubacteriales bacterium]
MNKFRDWVYRVMQGRYGVDELNRFFLVLALILMVVSTIVQIPALSAGVTVLLFLMYFRMFSRNIPKRYAENEKYKAVKRRIRGIFKGDLRAAAADPYHKIFRCPACQQKVRVPKGKGHIQIRCPKCGKVFIKET